MRRSAAAALAALVWTAGMMPAVLGQSPEWIDRLELAGGRVEVPEAGYALTFPDDWLVVRPMAADAERLVAGVREVEPELASVIEAGMARGMGLSLMAFGPVRDDGWSSGCNILSAAATGPIDDIAQAELANFELAGDAIIGGPDLVSVALPNGDVWRIDYEMGYRGIERANSAYFFHDGASLHTLTCADWEQPADDWRPIAQTFEFLPRTSGSAELGYEMVWPIGWAMIPPAADSPWLLEHADGGDAACVLVDENLVPESPGWTFEERVLQQREDFPERDIEVVSGLHASVDEAVRIDTSSGAAYLLSAGDLLYTLVCESRTGQPPADRWLPVARSIHLLVAD
jgi:hypothetical protein